MDGTPLYGFDIETDTTVNGLDPRVARIVSITLYGDPGPREVIDDASERNLIRDFLSLLDYVPPGIVCSWNGAVFDGAFVEDRASRLGLETGFVLVPDASIVPKYDFLAGHTAAYQLALRRHRHADLAYAYRPYADMNGVTWGLKPVCKSLGIEMIEVDRSRIHELSRAEERAYALSDARGTFELARRLGDDLEPWIDNLEPGQAARR